MPKNRHQDEDQANHVAQQADQAGGEHLVERLDVAGHPGHQAPDGGAIEEGRRQRQHVLVHAHAQGVHPALADELREVDLREGGGVLAEEHAEVGEADAIEPRQPSDGDVLVDRLLQEVGLRDLEQRDHRQQRHRDDQLLLVRPDEAEDPLEQRPVERLAEQLLGGRAPPGLLLPVGLTSSCSLAAHAAPATAASASASSSVR